jgi:tRNA nucleotidyltransferase (CCA-adding enzyme)
MHAGPLHAVPLPHAVVDALDRFARALRDRFGERVSEIVLFGSYARGAAHEESDVDVLVAIDELSDEERIEVLDLAHAANCSAADWVGIAPLAYSSAQATTMRSGGRRLFRDIDREGIRL